MKVKYLADDDTVFESETQCVEYERTLVARDELKAQAEKYLSMKEYKTDGARRRALAVIMGWLDYDFRQRPERYGREFPSVDDVHPIKAAG